MRSSDPLTFSEAWQWRHLQLTGVYTSDTIPSLMCLPGLMDLADPESNGADVSNVVSGEWRGSPAPCCRETTTPSLTKRAAGIQESLANSGAKSVTRQIIVDQVNAAYAYRQMSPIQHKAPTRVFRRASTEKAREIHLHSPFNPFDFPRSPSTSDADSPLSTPSGTTGCSRFHPGKFQNAADAVAVSPTTPKTNLHYVSPRALFDKERAKHSPTSGTSPLTMRKHCALSHSRRSVEGLHSGSSGDLLDSVEAKCTNFGDVLSTCAQRGSQDSLVGVEIVPILEDGEHTTTEVLYALQFEARGEAPILPGDGCTRLLFPRRLQVAARGGKILIKPSGMDQGLACPHAFGVSPAGGRRFENIAVPTGELESP